MRKNKNYVVIILIISIWHNFISAMEKEINCTHQTNAKYYSFLVADKEFKIDRNVIKHIKTLYNMMNDSESQSSEEIESIDCLFPDKIASEENKKNFETIINLLDNLDSIDNVLSNYRFEELISLIKCVNKLNVQEILSRAINIYVFNIINQKKLEDELIIEMEQLDPYLFNDIAFQFAKMPIACFLGFFKVQTIHPSKQPDIDHVCKKLKLFESIYFNHDRKKLMWEIGDRCFVVDPLNIKLSDQNITIEQRKKSVKEIYNSDKTLDATFISLLSRNQLWVYNNPARSSQWFEIPYEGEFRAGYLHFNPLNKNLIAAKIEASKGEYIYTIDLKTEKITRLFKNLYSTSNNLIRNYRLRFSPDGSLLYALIHHKNKSSLVGFSDFNKEDQLPLSILEGADFCCFDISKEKLLAVCTTDTLELYRIRHQLKQATNPKNLNVLLKVVNKQAQEIFLCPHVNRKLYEEYKLTNFLHDGLDFVHVGCFAGCYLKAIKKISKERPLLVTTSAGIIALTGYLAYKNYYKKCS